MNLDREPEAKLLVVDDEPNILELLSASLRYAGFSVRTASDGLEGIEQVNVEMPDLIVADIMMPVMDGQEMVTHLRARGDLVPVLFLTAKDSTQDKVSGLTVGGDDYVTKPFALDEVLARIRALLRRGGYGTPSSNNRLAFQDIMLDEDTHEVWKNGELVPLSPTEFNLLRYFMMNPGKVLSKASILDHVWEYDFQGNFNVVESYVSYLRRKLDTGDTKMFHTLRGVGYVLRRTQ
jgi:two-component system OmpR family response regulator